MTKFSAETLATMQRQLGLITAQQLELGGVRRTARQRLVNENVLERPFKSVYRVATRRPTFEQRLVALSLAHPNGFITGPTAGSYLGLRRMPRASKIHLCLPHPIRIEAPDGVLLRQSTRVGPLDVRTLENGIRIASWPRLLLDLAADLTKANLTSVIDQALQAQHCSLEEVGAIGDRLCHPTRRGSELFVCTLLERGNRKPVESHPELAVLNGLLKRGVPVEPQNELLLPNGKWVRIDLAVPAVRWAVEVDVHPAHNRPAGIVSDKQRDRQLHLIDWQVERVTENDLQDPASVFDELAALYRRRAILLAA
jgi:very-short-patch-repair endonuclease